MTDNVERGRGAAAASTDDPEQLREEIGQTREELGDTVEALSDKADVKGQISRKVDERKAAVRDKLAGARERASAATPDDAKRAAGEVAHRAEERPLPAIAVALGAGLLIGWMFGRR